MTGVSPLAHLIDRPKDVADRTARIYGVCVHTTGSTIVAKAKKLGVDPLEYAVAYYAKPESYSAHYLIGYDGTIIQISNEKEKCLHVGLSTAERASFLDGSWKRKLSTATVNLWTNNWPSIKSPSHLYPGSSVNNAYVGIEMLQSVSGGVWFTQAQHRAVADLACDIAVRNEFPPGWWRSGRLAGHEDLNPLTRSNKGGGWDPGFLRETPWFDMDLVRQSCYTVW